MNYQRFIDLLPNLYDNWGQDSVCPKSNQFQQVIDQVKGETTANELQLINLAVKCMEPDEIYCEVGYSSVATLIGALLNNSEKLAYTAIDFSKFEGEVFEKFSESLSAFCLEDQVVICEQDFDEFLFEIREIRSDIKIGVYACKAANDYRTQLLELLLVRPLLADKALIIVNNSNVSAVKQAIWDFIAAQSQIKMLLNLSVSGEYCHGWYDGIQVLSWDISREHNYNLLELKQQHDDTFLQAIYKWQVEFEYQKKTRKKMIVEALELENYQRYEEAESKYIEILKWEQNQPEILFNLGMLYYKTNRYQQALDLLLRSLGLKPTKVPHLYYYSIGQVLEKIGAFSQAIQAYQQAIALESKCVDAYNNLGNILLNSGELDQAESIYQQAIIENPEHFGSYLNLGNVLMERHQPDKAVEIYKKALSLKPRDPDIIYNLALALDTNNEPAQAALHYGYAHYRRGQYQEAIDQYQQFLETQTGDLYLYLALAQCYHNINQHEETLKTYQEGIKLYPKSTELYFSFALALQDFGRTQEAIAVLTEASQLLPEFFNLKIEKQRMLPVVYETEEEVDFYRHRFIQGLEELVQQISLDTPESRRSALVGVGSHTNFYLQYQGKNDLELQKQYGQFVSRVMSASYPQWVKPLTMPPRDRNGKIRIGYVSQFLKQHTVGKLVLGWFRNYNREEFEIYCYYTARSHDLLSQQFLLHSDFFHHIPEDLEALCEQILADQLHILIYTDLGMDPQMTQMAGLRLAPVQCTTWGHPITSGLPTIDYFLSSDLMEPENAENHYSEQLIRLPNVGFSYSKPILPELTKTRSDFQVRDDAVLYLSCQSLYKYLPQYDYVFAAIAQQVPQAQFAFLSHQSFHITEKLRQRLKRAFASIGLNSEDYCVILPRLSWTEYLNLNLTSDVFLDTFSWSGGNTTLEAIACKLPVVTCPGDFMRGRHSYGILRMLGVTDTIAESEAQYIKIAVKLGRDREWRDSIVERMMQRHSYLYDDQTCVEALEAFYHHVVQEGQ